MKKFFQKILLWIYIKIQTILINISIALYRTEEEVLKAPQLDVGEDGKIIQRKLHHNPLLEKFYAGQRDEKYVQDYYELLVKADKFLHTATSHQRLVAMDRHMRQKNSEEWMNQKDPHGRRYNYAGFFDDNHKHAGKTIAEVVEIEFEERRTKDDDFELLEIYDNRPIEAGVSKLYEEIEKAKEDKSEFEVTVMKSLDFPIRITHTKENIVNKIEQLTESLHVKKIGFEHRQLEFFIPLKFKTSGVTDQSEIFNELIDVKEIFIRDKYGKMIAFGVTKFLKRIIHNDTHEVWKFQGIEMKQMGMI